MSAAKKWTVCVFFCLMTVCFYVLSVHQMYLLTGELEDITFVAKGETGFADAPSRELRTGLLWRADEGFLIENTVWNKTAESTVFALHGRSDYLLKNTWVLDTGSNNSCIISSALAYELFGNGAVKGSVQYNGNSYEIVDIIQCSDNLFFYEPRAEMGIVYDRFTQKNAEEQALDVVEQTLQMQLGNGALLDYTLIRVGLEVVLLILPVCLGIKTIRAIWEYQKMSRTFKEKAMWSVILFLIAAVIGIGIVKNIHFPMDLIPGRWSDFEFWADKFEDKKQALLFLVKTSKTVFDLQILRRIGGVILYNCGAMGMGIATFRSLRKIERRSISRKISG